MAGKAKHAERSHRNHGMQGASFGYFHLKAHDKKVKKVQKQTMGEMLKSMFHKTTNK